MTNTDTKKKPQLTFSQLILYLAGLCFAIGGVGILYIWLFVAPGGSLQAESEQEVQEAITGTYITSSPNQETYVSIDGKGNARSWHYTEGYEIKTTERNTLKVDSLAGVRPMIQYEIQKNYSGEWIISKLPTIPWMRESENGHSFKILKKGFTSVDVWTESNQSGGVVGFINVNLRKVSSYVILDVEGVKKFHKIKDVEERAY